MGRCLSLAEEVHGLQSSTYLDPSSDLLAGGGCFGLWGAATIEPPDAAASRLEEPLRRVGARSVRGRHASTYLAPPLLLSTSSWLGPRVAPAAQDPMLS